MQITFVSIEPHIYLFILFLHCFFCFVLFFICFYFFVVVFLKGLVLFSVRGELRSVQDLKQCSVIAAYRDKNNTLLSEYICNAVTAKKY